MSAAWAAAFLAAAGAAALVPDSRAGRRLPRESGRLARAPAGKSRWESVVEDGRRRAPLCALACWAAGAMLFGALAGVVSALAGLLLSWWIGRLEPPSVVRARRTVTRDLPLAADLLAACAAVGHPPTHSLRTVAAAVDGPLGATLNGLVARLELGADPYLEWRRISEDEGLGQLGRTMLRTLESGAPLVDSLIRLADDSRREWRGQMQEQARQVGVRAAAPLAACFLPSFMLVGVVPTVVSALSGLGFAR